MSTKLVILLIVALQLSLTLCLYGSSSKVQSLTQSNFDTKVKRSGSLSFVEFYAPWCGHCKNLAPEYEKLAKALEGIVTVGAVDMTTDQAVGSPYNIQGFPTIKFFGDRGQVLDYNGARTAQAMLDFALQQVKQTAEKRLTGKSSSGSSSGGSRKTGGSGSGPVDLTDDNFDELVMKSEESWFIKFYAPWCGHCKQLAPTWKDLAGELNGQVKVAHVDCTVHQKLAQRFGVNGYPTLKFFPGGKKSDSRVQDYSGGRDSGSLREFALAESKKSQPVKFQQLTSQDDFKKYCEDQRGVCLIGFLPHIYDSSAEERNRYIKMLEKAADKYKSQPVSFLWSQGGDQYELEEGFALGSGYPSLLAISVSKNASTVMRKSFTTENISSFISGLIAGQEQVQPIRQKIAKISKVSKWDGKDKKPASEDL